MICGRDVAPSVASACFEGPRALARTCLNALGIVSEKDEVTRGVGLGCFPGVAQGED